MKQFTESILQVILALSPDTLKYAFFCFGGGGGGISELPKQNNMKVTVKIAQMWEKHFMGEGKIIIGEAEDKVRERDNA